MKIFCKKYQKKFAKLFFCCTFVPAKQKTIENMKTNYCTTLENGIEKNVISICLDSLNEYNYLENVIFAVLENLQEITVKDYNFVNFEWYINGQKNICSSNWIISEETKTAKDFFLMEADKTREYKGIKYIVNPWLNNSFYISANGKYFYMDK